MLVRIDRESGPFASSVSVGPVWKDWKATDAHDNPVNVFFPNGAIVYSINWMSVVKTQFHEVLIALFHSVIEPLPIRTADILYVSHHSGLVFPSRDRSVWTLAKPVLIPAMSAVWLYADGYGSLPPSQFAGNPVEVQTIIEVDDNTAYVPCYPGK